MFFKKHKKFSVSETLWRSLFLTSSVSFLVFLSLDLLRPGFVSRTFSVHIFLIVAIISGFGWSRAVKEHSEGKWTVSIVTIFIGLIAVCATWQFRADLSDFLVIVLPLALISPFLVKYLISNK